MVKEMRKRLTVLSLALLFVFATAMGANAGDSLHTRGEKPEHPEHPEHPEDGGMMGFHVDKDVMAKAITDYVNMDSELKGGYFLFYDAKDKKPLALTLTKVHKDRLSQVGTNLYFACSDFKEAGGTMYDLDFFMKNVDDQLQVTDVKVHKKAGKPRYTWHEKNGMWMTMPMK